MSGTKKGNKPGVMQSVGIGAIACIFTVNFTHPIELIKTRMQVTTLFPYEECQSSHFSEYVNRITVSSCVSVFKQCSVQCLWVNISVREACRRYHMVVVASPILVVLVYSNFEERKLFWFGIYSRKWSSVSCIPLYTTPLCQVTGNPIGMTVSSLLKNEGAAALWKGIPAAWGREGNYYRDS